MTATKVKIPCTKYQSLGYMRRMHSLIYSLQQHHEVPINLLSLSQMSLLRCRKAK